MTRKLVISLVALTLSVTGVTTTRWLCCSDRPAAHATTKEKEAAEAAARHAQCQPRHWRYLMLQQQH